MNIIDYGWNNHFEEKYKAIKPCLKPARVIGHNSNVYKVITNEGFFFAEVSGKLVGKVVITVEPA
jgi:hypothetical protein